MGVLMALVDFLPVTLFAAGAIYLQRDLYNKMFKGIFGLFAMGTITTVVAGSYKALWKLLYGLKVCDFVVLNTCFFPMQTTGFGFTALALIAFMVHGFDKNPSPGRAKAYSLNLLPLLIILTEIPKYTSNMVFVIAMVLSVVVMDVILMIIASKIKSPLAIVFYIVSLIFVLGMGYMSSKDFTNPMMNWIAEAINIVGQGCFLLGSMEMHHKGLATKKIA